MNNVRPIKSATVLYGIFEGLQEGQSWHERRVYLLFATGVYTGLRISDIVGLKVENVRGNTIELIETKTGKLQRAPIGKDLRAIYDDRLEGLNDNDYLFPSRKHYGDGQQRHITTRAASYDMQFIARKFGIKGPFGCHSMRKTYGYMMYKYNSVTVESLRQWFNHANEATTRRYICIDEEEREKAANNFHPGGFKPKKEKKGKPGRRKDSVPLETKYHDRTENGRKYAEKMREKSKKGKKGKKGKS